MAVKISKLIKHAQDPAFRRLLEQAYEPVRKARARLPRWYAPWRYLRKPCDCPTSAHKEAYTRAMPTIVGLGVILGLPALIISLAKNNWFSLPGFVLFIAVLWFWVTRYHVWQDHLPEREVEVERQDEQALEDLLKSEIEGNRAIVRHAFERLEARYLNIEGSFRRNDQPAPYRVSTQMVDPAQIESGIRNHFADLESLYDHLLERLDELLAPRLPSFGYTIGHVNRPVPSKAIWYYVEYQIVGFLSQIRVDVETELKTLDRLFVQTDRDQYLRDLETCASWAKDGEPSGVRITTDDQSVSEELQVEARAQDQAPCLAATK